MSKTFRPRKIDEPPLVQDFVAEGDLARFVLSLLRDEIEYESDRGQPPLDPVMMTALLLYSYCCGIYASRRIAAACREQVDFMSIVGFDAPDFRTVSEFRRRHLKALGGLYTQILHLCETTGLVKLRHVALNGTKVKANASKHKAISYERMEKRAAELEAEVAKWLAVAESSDAADDKRYGADKSGEEMPDWVADEKRRAARIRQAKAELEGEAKAAADELKAAAEAQAQRNGRRAQEARSAGRSALDHARTQSAEELHRSGEPDHEEQGRLCAGLQRPDRD
jgi:transposase